MDSIEAIGVIGIACRLQGGISGPDELWQALRRRPHDAGEGHAAPVDAAGRDRDRSPATTSPTAVSAAAGAFDATYFGLSVPQVQRLDARLRSLLELTVEALEDARIRPSTLAGSTTGVFLRLGSDAGSANGPSGALRDGDDSSGDVASAAAYIAHRFGLRGPTSTLDPARCSALRVVDLAVESLRNHECDLAIVGTADVPDDASGTAIVVLCRSAGLSEHRASAYAHVLHGAVGAADRSPGTAWPGATVAAEALARSEVSIDDVVFVETDELTGLGDAAAESRALDAFFGMRVPSASPVPAGSVDTGIGRPGGTSGLTGFIKSVLALHHRELPPASACRVREETAAAVRESTPLGSGDEPPVAVVSSTGPAGTHVHLVLRSAEAAPPVAAGPGTGQHLLLLSAHSPPSLDALVERYATVMREPRDDVADTCAAAARREARDHRAAFVARSAAGLAAELDAFVSGTVVPAPGAARGPILVFSGVGGQWPGMAADLIEGAPVFRRSFLRWSSALEGRLGWSPEAVCTGSDDGARIDEMRYSMPCIVAVQASLFDLLMSWGLTPAGIIGHSVGEIAAAYASGVLDFDDTLEVVVARHDAELAGRGGGGMAVVSRSESEVIDLFVADPLLEVAGLNGPEETVVAGPREALETFVRRMRDIGVQARRVRTDVACHTSVMQEPSEALEHALRGITARPGTLPVFSCTTGGGVEGNAMGPAHWRRNLRDVVRFWPVLRRLLHEGHRTFLEVGPHPVLLETMARGIRSLGLADMPVGTLRRERPSGEALLRAAGELWTQGAELNWERVVPGDPHRGHLPRYPWQRSPAVPRETGGDERSPAAPSPRVDEPRVARMIFEAPQWQRPELVTAFVRRQVARILGSDPNEDPDIDAPFKNLGMTSVLLTELVYRLGAGMGFLIEPMDCFDKPSIRRLSGFLFTRLEGREDVTPSLSAADDRRGTTGSAAGADPISILGAGCRFPGGVSSLADYWELLERGESGVVDVPAERWPPERYYDPDPDVPGRMSTRRGGFIHDVDCFDAEFFGISAAEAARMDPQQRLLLETAWTALEHAGIDPTSLDGSRTGVFIGAMNTNDYLARKESGGQAEGWSTVYDCTSVANSALAGRISYVLGTGGPAMTIDTACSSSLVALHTAATSIRNGECDVALVGGVNLILAPWTSIAFSQARMLSPDGECRTFSADANGYVRGEGCAVVVLMRRTAAMAAGLRPWANILGSAVNQNGRTSGLTAPSESAQRRVIRAALKAAGRSATDVAYVEAHGTGTPLGDPIEMRALSSVMATASSRPDWFVGSVKTNIGHLEAGAGMAGLLKAVLAVGHGRIPLHRGLRELNPAIDLAGAGATIPREVTPWPAGYRSRVVGVSSFGYTGSNAHVIVEAESEADNTAPVGETLPQGLVLPLSAKSASALAALAAAYERQISTEPESAAALCHTAAVARAHHGVRATVVADDAPELLKKLGELARADPAGRRPGGSSAMRAPRVAFLFPGQGSQYAGMGRRLREQEPVFGQVLDECASLAAAHGIDLDTALRAADESVLRQTRHTQPTIFALQASLLALLRSWGITPFAVIGHSMGEFAAAYAAGAVTLETAMAIICRRALVMEAMPPGAMLAAEMSRERFARYEGLPPISLAADNGPRSIVLSGAHDAVQHWHDALRHDGIRCRRLDVSHAFHSSLMDGALDGALDVLQDATFEEPQVPMVSTVHGDLLGGSRRLTPRYWLDNLRQPVLFREGMVSLSALRPDILLEVGPSPVLLSNAVAATDARLVATLRGHGDEGGSLRQMLGTLYGAGVDIDWKGYYRGHMPHAPGAAPTYPFERTSHWVPFHGEPESDAFDHPFLAPPVVSGTEARTSGLLSVADHLILDGHRLHGTPVLPAASVLDAVCRVARHVAGEDMTIGRCEIHTPISVLSGHPVEVVIVVDVAAGHFQVLKDSTGEVLADGTIMTTPEPCGDGMAFPVADGGALEISGDVLRSGWEKRGLVLGPELATVRHASVTGTSFEATIRLPPVWADDPTWQAQVALDAVFQAVGVVLQRMGGPELWLPSAFEGVRLSEAVPAECIARGDLIESSERMCSFRLTLSSRDGEPVAVVHRAEFRRAPVAVLATTLMGKGLGASRIVPERVSLETRPPLARRRWTVVGSDCSLRKEVVNALAEGPAAVVHAGVEHLQGVDAVAIVLAADSDATPDEAVYGALAELHRLTRMVLAAPGRIGVHVVVDRSPEYFSAAIRAFCRSLALEEDTRWGGGIDVAADVEPTSAASAIVHLLARSPGEWLSWRPEGYERHTLLDLADVPTGVVSISPTGTYVVSGGLGGLGLAIAEWLVGRGARSLVLVGRSDPTAPARSTIDRLRGSGAVVDVRAGDVARRDDVAGIIAPIRDEVRGVVHCAGVLNDALVATQPWSEQELVLDPKVRGAVNLHNQTLECDLDFFVSFSSVASYFGAHGQTAYAAANGFLDGLMAWRQEHGLPGLSLSWPAWIGSGMAHRGDRAGVRYWEGRARATSIDLVLGTHLFGRLAASSLGHVVIGARHHVPGVAAGTVARPSGRGARARHTADTASRIASGSRVERLRTLETIIVGHLEPLTGSRPDLLLGGTTFREMGLDSFQLIELRSKLRAEGIEVSTDLLLGEVPASEVAARILDDEPAPATSAAIDHSLPQGALRAAVEAMLEAGMQAVAGGAFAGFARTERSLRDQGLDSFQLIELRRLLVEHGLDISTERLLSGEPTETIVAGIVTGIIEERSAAAPSPGAQPRPGRTARHSPRSHHGDGGGPAPRADTGLAPELECALPELTPIMSTFINGTWQQDRFRVRSLDITDSALTADVSAERFVMPADGVYHLPVFQAFMWTELLCDLYTKVTRPQPESLGAELRSFTLLLPERISQPERIQPRLEVREVGSSTRADFTVTGGGRWSGSVIFEARPRGAAAFPLEKVSPLPMVVDAGTAQSCFDHYWNRFKDQDLAADRVALWRERIETTARWNHGDAPIAPFTLMRWASQLCLIHAHWRHGLEHKPANEAYVARVEVSLSGCTPRSRDVALSFAPDHEVVHDGVLYLTGTFRADDFATIRIQLTVPLTDHGPDRRNTPDVRR